MLSLQIHHDYPIEQVKILLPMFSDLCSALFHINKIGIRSKIYWKMLVTHQCLFLSNALSTFRLSRCTAERLKHFTAVIIFSSKIFQRKLDYYKNLLVLMFRIELH